MAVTSYTPLSPTIPDAVSFKEASALFAETGHPASANTLVRWAREKDYYVERIGRTDYVSYSDLLEVHAEKVKAAEAGA